MRYDNIILSLYGTLIDIRTDENDPRLWEELSSFYSWQGAYMLPYSIKAYYDEEVRRKFSDSRLLRPQIQHVDIDLLKVFEALYRKGGLSTREFPLKETAEFFRERSTQSIRLRPGAVDLLDRAEEEGAKLYLLCNGQSCFSLTEMRRLGIDDYFEAAYFSSDHGIAKPETAFYDLLLENEGIDPGSAVMIGSDLQQDIKGAKEAGIDSIFVNSGGIPTEGETIPSVFVVKNGDLAEVSSFLFD